MKTKKRELTEQDKRKIERITKKLLDEQYKAGYVGLRPNFLLMALRRWGVVRGIFYFLLMIFLGIFLVFILVALIAVVFHGATVSSALSFLYCLIHPSC